MQEAHLLHTAHGLKIDVVSLAGSQRGVPKTLICPVVPHCERGGFREVSRREFCRKVIRRPPAHGMLVGHRNLVALHGPCFSLGSVWVQLLHDDLIGTLENKEKRLKFRNWRHEVLKCKTNGYMRTCPTYKYLHSILILVVNYVAIK